MHDCLPVKWIYHPYRSKSKPFTYKIVIDMYNNIPYDILWTNSKCSREIQTYKVAAFHTPAVCYE